MNNRFALMTALCCCALTACTRLDMADVPAPGNSYTDGYPVTFEFASVLNLPAQAKVVMDGTRIGTVTDATVAGTKVDVDARIDSAVAIPADIHAVLQQDTVLGDIYVALVRDDTTRAAPLAERGTLPLAQTSSPPQLEDTLAVIANFVTSGSIQRIQNSINGINAAMPGPTDQVRALAQQTATDLDDLADNIDQVDTWLTGLDSTVGVLSNRIPTLAYYVSPDGQRAWDRTTFTNTYIATVLPSIGSIYQGGFWLVPLLESVGDALGAVKTPIVDLIGEGPAWQTVLTRYLLPFAHQPTVNLTSITTADGQELTGNVESILRMLGAVP